MNQKVIIRLFSLFLFVTFTINSFSQNQIKIDSLENELKKFETGKSQLHGTVNILYDSTKAIILYRLAAEYGPNNPEKLKEYARQLLLLSQKIGYKKGIGNAYTCFGAYYTYKGEPDTALIYDKMSYEIGVETGDKKSIANYYNNSGVIYYDRGNFTEAMKQYLGALKTYEELRDKTGEAHSYQAIGNVYSSMRKFEDATENFMKALNLYKAIGDNPGIGSCYASLGTNCYEQLKYDEALKYDSAAVQIFLENDYSNELSNLYLNMGDTYKDKGDNEEALKSYLNSLKIAEETEDETAMAGANIGVGKIYEIANKLPEALKYLIAGLELSKKSELKELMSEAYRTLAVVYAKSKNFEAAFGNEENFLKTYEELFNKESEKNIEKLQLQYESDKKEAALKADKEKKEIELNAEKKRLIISTSAFGVILAMGGTLFYVNRKRKTYLYKQNLAESEMKALRAQMNPHFMFNSLNSIQQMVLNNENDNAFKYLDTYSKLTRKILENSEKKWITVHEEIKFLELYLQIESLRFQNAFEFEIKTDENISAHMDKIPAMIIQPIVENAIKHGLMRKDGDKKLLISFTRKDDDAPLEIIIEDNGVGREFTMSLEKKTDHQSMSLSITENRLRLLDEDGNSKIIIEDLKSDDNEKSLGTRVKVIIPQPD
jgi:tetratricopeptide (TPR) repeat protein